MNKTKKISLTALLLSSNIILARLVAIRTNVIMIDFAFITIIIASIVLGVKYSILVATLGDIFGSLLFPMGTYFIGFSLTACLTGLTYGLFLSRPLINNNRFKIKLFLSIVIVTIGLNGILNTIWLFVIMSNASMGMLPIRILKQIVMMPIIYITTLKMIPTIKKIENWCHSD